MAENKIMAKLMELDSKVSQLRPLSVFGRKEATFRAKIMKLGRITIPEVERKTLGLKDGDVVEVVLRKVREHG